MSFSGRRRRRGRPNRAIGHQVMGFSSRPHDDIDTWTTRLRPTLRQRRSGGLVPLSHDRGYLVRPTAILEARSCERCGTRLSRHNLDKTCGPCAVTIRDIEDAHGGQLPESEDE